jgi:thymidylate kinase
VTKYIIVEGPDGSGKSEVTRIASQMMRTAHMPTFITREPGGTNFGEAVRELLLGHPSVTPDVPAVSKAMLFAACSFANARKLPEKTICLSDRWAPISSRIYQVQTARDVAEANGVQAFWNTFVEHQLHLMPTAGTALRPTLLIYLRTSAEIAWARVNQRKGDTHDNMDDGRFEKARDRISMYGELFKHPKVYDIPRVVIDTDDLDQQQVATEVMNAIIRSIPADEASQYGINRVEL